jgi:hypothetical protein
MMIFPVWTTMTFAGESPPLGGDLSSWHRLRPASTRPYGGLYAH